MFINNTTFAHLNNVTDQQALVSLNSSITGDPLGALSSWNHSVHFCLWKGVTCSRKRQRVTALDLSSQKLQGTLSPHIGNLTFLRLINLADNSFHGYIPNEVGRLFRLCYLQLANNSFQGSFPQNLTRCADIRGISLGYNNLQGKLPTTFASWSKLNRFDLVTNHFSGSIPPSIGNISSLRILDLGQNNLAGSIPLEVGNLLKLEYFQLLGENQLTGRLPPDLGFTLPYLQYFLVAYNKFSGPFPHSITNSSHVTNIDISSNNITGPIPFNLGTNLQNLRFINLGDNPLGHKGDLSFFDSLVNCTHLNLLNIGRNGLSGELPNSIANLSTTLQHLDLFENYLHGSIPHEIGKLVNLRYLGLRGNTLTGSIPESIGQLSRLEEIYLYGNNISGAIPHSISNIKGLLMLSLHTNMLQGSIPAALFNLSTLLGLDLSTNHPSRVIPEQLSGLSSLSIALYLQNNLLTGPLPSEIGSLKYIVELIVSDNQLTGKIPDTLGDCLMLEELYLDGNFFEGGIPSSLKALKSLVHVDLSSNNISGTIPNFLGEFHLIQYLNLSLNKFVDEVPREGVFSNLSKFSVDSNLKLCGGIQALHLPVCPVKISRTKKKKISLRILLLAVILPVAILLACLALLFYRINISKQKNVPVSVLQDDQYPRVSYQDLLLATSEFSRKNLLGEGRYGSVYRGVLESLQQTVAVKVLNVEVQGAHKSFLSECGALRNIRHRSLIKIITACSSTDFNGNFKALVFEFMTNGSLDNWLHQSPSDQGNERSLTLLQRLNISIDVALAIDYLHHRSQTQIIHCDIKPSNILLDEEFVARVGDFGLARFFPNIAGDINHAQTSSTGIRGTVGYVPPEYGMGGEISTEGDVYSYGILLLEMFSGKKPTGISISMENANNLHDYVSEALPYRVLDIADPRIILQNENHASIQVCLTTIFEVGRMCSVATPKERIDITVALRQLHVARSPNYVLGGFHCVALALDYPRHHRSTRIIHCCCVGDSGLASLYHTYVPAVNLFLVYSPIV